MPSDYAKLLPFFFVGNVRSRYDLELLKTEKVRLIVNVGSADMIQRYLESPLSTEDEAATEAALGKSRRITLVTLNARDQGDVQSVDNLTYIIHQTKLIHDITNVIARGRSVLVHCYAGKHRSPCIGIAVLMRVLRLSYDMAYKEVKRTWSRTSERYHRALKKQTR